VWPTENKLNAEVVCSILMPSELAPPIVRDVIGDELSRTEFKDIAIRKDDYFFLGDQYITPNYPDTNFCVQILDRISTNHFNSTQDFYHFKQAERIIDVLRHKTILAANLPAHSDRDNDEFSAFMRILGHDDWFMEATPEEAWYSKEYGKKRIDDWRGGVYILSLTKSVREYMWVEYAGTPEHPATGACLIFGFQGFDKSQDSLIQPLYTFRDTFYENTKGDRFAFFKKIDDRILAATGKRILFSKMQRYSEFYKGFDYRNDEEARLTFNTRYIHTSFGIFLPNHYSITHYPTPKPWGALSLPLFDAAEPKDVMVPFFGLRKGLPSPHFKIIVKGIILGKNISIEDRKTISELAKRNFPSAFIE
jgi:hypothetical protein